MKRSTDQREARLLVLACRRLDRAITSRRAAHAEKCRAEVVTHMADLLREFGMEEVAEYLLTQIVPAFDGRHLN